MYPFDIPYLTILHFLHARTAERHVKYPKLIQFHFVSIDKRPLNFFHQSFDHVFHVTFGHSTILLNTGGKGVNIHRAGRAGFLTKIKQHRRVFITHDFSTLEAFYKYIHKS